ncbi:PH domain-containing protein [Coniochaeta sp. 2T2.1]|nr:PH domain-containing protein [Coniochaeta sp. 2T2.1]
MGRQANVAIPPTAIDIPRQSQSHADRFRSRLGQDAFSPVNQNGSFEFDRVMKSGYVQKRTQRTKTWKPIYLVLRPNTLSIYKSDKEDKLRHKIYLSDLTAVTLLKDPKQKRQNVFGLFSPARNFHFQAETLKDAKEWVELIRKDARIEEEEEEMFLASPVVQRRSFLGFPLPSHEGAPSRQLADHDRMMSSSPEPQDIPMPVVVTSPDRRPSQFDSSGMSGGELASHSDFSDADVQRLGASIESLALQTTPTRSDRPPLGLGNASQTSGINIEKDPDRVIWQGRLLFLRSKRGVRQWKNMWAVLRPRNLILYKDESEYSARFIIPMSSIVNVVDIDPVSRTKTHCLQVITDEKSYRFCAHDEETLVQCLGAFKSLLAKRKELEAKVAAANAAAAP